MDKKQAEKAIASAWGAGLVSGVVTLVVALVAVRSGERYMGFSALNLLDVAVIGGLSFGISRRSRVCAVAMLLYWISSKLILWREAGKPQGVVTAIVFGWFFIQGVRGTFAWHAQGGGPTASSGAALAAGRRFNSREEYEEWKASRTARTE
jgi:serine/threonine-protein kinase